MSDVVKLAVAPAREEVRESIVKDLRGLLEQAERGELESLCWFAESATSRSMTWGTSGCLSVPQQLGRLDIVRHTLLREFTDGT